MFDVGISEILVIAVVALVVIGPERLPRVARTVGTLLGRAQRYVADVKAEVNREMELEELRKLQSQMQDAARSIQQEVSSAGAQVQGAVTDAELELNQTLAAATAAHAASASVPVTEVTPLSEPPQTPRTSEAMSTGAAAAEGEGGASPLASGSQGHGSPASASGNASASEGSGTPAAPATIASAAADPDAPQQSSLFPEHTIR